MRSVPVTAYVSELTKKRLEKRAKKRCLPISGYLSRLIDRDDENNSEKGDDLCKPIAELKRRLESARDPKNCIAFNNAEEAIEYMYKICNEANI
jgi:hypothetical protein